MEIISYTLNDLKATHTWRGMWWFKSIEGEEFRAVPRSVRAIYASNLGRVFIPGEDGERPRRPLLVMSRGRTKEYKRVGVYTKSGLRSVPIHQLIAEAFLGPLPNGMCVRHLDGDIYNNRLSNLAYGTHEDNRFDAAYHGPRPISDSLAVEVYWLSMSHLFSVDEVALIFNLTPKFVKGIADRRVYKWIHADELPAVMPSPRAPDCQRTFQAITEMYFN